MVLIAPAVDFTEELMWKQFDAEVKREIKLKGQWSRPSEYSDEPYMITRKLIEDGRKHLILDGVIETGCPVRILQGVQRPGRAVAARGRAGVALRRPTTWCSR